MVFTCVHAGWIYKCDGPEMYLSFWGGSALLSFTLCTWVLCGTYFTCSCNKKRRVPFIGCVIAYGVFIVLPFIFYCVINVLPSVTLTESDIPLNNATLHCLSPYWLVYAPTFASTTIFACLIFSLCCCVSCRRWFRILNLDSSYNRYGRFWIFSHLAVQYFFTISVIYKLLLWQHIHYMALCTQLTIIMNTQIGWLGTIPALYFAWGDYCAYRQYCNN